MPSESTDARTVADTIASALVAYDALAELGGSIDDEWTYVDELSAAWRDRLEAVAAERALEITSPAVDLAVGRAADEVSQIRDPHRAIDWLSTFPQIVLLALEEVP